ncbi:MAG: hypothetical protein ACI841_002238 [Planctomycetota bacterium]|jgi:hypothetical protein
MSEQRDSPVPRGPRPLALTIGFFLCMAITACLARQQHSAVKHGWWQGLGPVLPHDSFPADCGLCHLEGSWQELRLDFEYNHQLETGVELRGVHTEAQCLRCHNDRGPVDMFAERGCMGCHEDIHQGTLGADCASCHGEHDWRPKGQVARHFQTRFPLIGVHATTDCRRCHLGAEVGRFVPTDTECASCHQQDLVNANDPNHVGLGYIDRCDRCHTPTNWNHVSFTPR